MLTVNTKFKDDLIKSIKPPIHSINKILITNISLYLIVLLFSK